MPVICGRGSSAHEDYAKTSLDSYHRRLIVSRAGGKLALRISDGGRGACGRGRAAYSLVVPMGGFLYIAGIYLAMLLA